MAFGNWFDQNDPANLDGSPFPAPAEQSGDGMSAPTWNPEAQAQNTGISGYGAPNGTQTPTVTPRALPGRDPWFDANPFPEGGTWEQQQEWMREAAKHNGTSGGAGSPGSLAWIQDQLRRVNSTDDANYWLGVIGKDPKVAAGDQSAIDYWIDRIRRGDGSELVRNGTLQKFADGGGGSGMGGYDFGAGTRPYKDFTVGDFMADPGYQFTLGQGLQAIDRRRAAQGGLNTGGTEKARMNYASGLANQTYNDFFNRQAGTYDRNQGNYFTGLNSAFDKWYRTTQLGANAAAQ